MNRANGATPQRTGSPRPGVSSGFRPPARFIFCPGAGAPKGGGANKESRSQAILSTQLDCNFINVIV